MGLLDFLPQSEDAQQLEERGYLESVLKGMLAARTAEARAETGATFVVHVGLERAMALLIDLLGVREAGSAESSVTIGAMRCLREIGRDALPRLMEALEDENPLVQKRAAMVLGEIGDKAAIGSLTPLVEDGKSYVREAAQDALDKLGELDM